MDFRETIISQYHAALEMLKQTILACPEALWHNSDDRNKFSQIAYHALFYTHLYLQESEQAFQLWSGHREEYRLGGGDSTAPAEPATKTIVLAYLAFCRRQVVEKVPTTVFPCALILNSKSRSNFPVLLDPLANRSEISNSNSPARWAVAIDQGTQEGAAST